MCPEPGRGLRGGLWPAVRAGGAWTLENAAHPELMAPDALPEPVRAPARSCRDEKATGGGWGRRGLRMGDPPPTASAAVRGSGWSPPCYALGKPGALKAAVRPPPPRAQPPSQTRVPPWTLLLFVLLPVKFFGERKRRNKLSREETWCLISV